MTWFQKIFLLLFGWLTGGWCFFVPKNSKHLTPSNKFTSSGGAKDAPQPRTPVDWERYIVLSFSGAAAHAYPACVVDVWWFPRVLPWMWVKFQKPIPRGQATSFGVGEKPADFFFVSTEGIKILAEYHGEHSNEDVQRLFPNVIQV